MSTTPSSKDFPFQARGGSKGGRRPKDNPIRHWPLDLSLHPSFRLLLAGGKDRVRFVFVPLQLQAKLLEDSI
jgi:hypothetical protein